MSQPSYGMTKTLANTSVDDAVERVTAALKEQGFGVLTTIDVKSTLKKKLDVDFRHYRILGACNPTLAHKALGIEEHAGLLLPCNVVVQEKGDDCEVSFIAPKAMFSVLDDDSMAEVVHEAEERLSKALAALS